MALAGPMAKPQGAASRPNRSPMPPTPRSPLSVPIKVILLCLTTAAVGAVGNVIVRQMSFDMHIGQIAFFRNLFGFLSAIVLLPLVAAPGQAMFAGALPIPPRIWGASLLNIISMICFFAGIALMPLGDMTALSFASPVWATIGAALFLKETVRRSRWIATIGGLIGVVVILRPGMGAFTLPALLVIAGTLAYSMSTLVVKTAGRSQNALTIVMQMALLMTLASAGPAIAMWHETSLTNWVLGALLGSLATLGWFALTRALSMADASSVQPYDFARLPFTIIPAYFLFGEVPDAFALLGSAIIFASALYASRQEMRR